MKKYNTLDSQIKKSAIRQINHWLVLLLSFAIGGLIWVLQVGVGVGTGDLAGSGEGFFVEVVANLVFAFSSPIFIIGSVLDIALLVVLIFVLIIFMHKNSAFRLVKFFLPVIVAFVVISNMFVLPVLSVLFDDVAVMIFAIIIIMFPQELRRTMWKLASPKETAVFSSTYDCSEDELNEAVSGIVKASLNMSKNNEGALIVLLQQSAPQHLIETGVEVDSVISSQLIECIFNTNANLHDGAMFVYGNRIISAGCFLPLSQSQSLPKELGTRHRAAIGVSEQYSVVVIVVSEETGVISVCRDGEIDMYYDSEMLTDVIMQSYGLKADRKSLDGVK